MINQAQLPTFDVRQASEKASQGLLILIFSSVILAGVTGYLLVDPITIARGWSLLIASESLLILLLTFGPLLVRRIRSPQPDLLEPAVIFGLIYCLVFTVRPLFLISPMAVYMDEVVGEIHQALNFSPASLALALAYGIAGIIAFHAGYRTLQEPSDLPRRGAGVPVWSSTRVTHVAILAIIWAVVSFLVVYRVVGGVGGAITEFGRVRGLLVGYGYEGLGLDLLVMLVPLLWVDHLRGKSRLILIPLLLFSNIYNLVIGSRAGVFNVWILMYLLYRYLTGKRFTRRQVVAGLALAVLVVVFTISLGEVRMRGFGDLAGMGETVVEFWQGSTTGLLVARVLLEFNQVDIFAQMLERGSGEFPLRWGETYWQVIYQPIPRAWWPEKPWTFDVEIGQMVQGVRTGIPPSMVGELYLNFHVPGIIVGMFLFGAGCRWVYRRLLATPVLPGHVLMYALLATFLPIMITRSFVPAFTTLAVYMGPAWLAIRYITRPTSIATK